MDSKKKLIVLVIALSLILLISSSYALLRSSKLGKNSYAINVGDLKVSFKDGQTEKLNLTNMYPMTDEEGMSQEDVLSFTIENTGTVGSYYDVSIEELSTSPEFKSVIKYISNKDDGEYTEPKILSDNKYIELTGYLESGVTITYKVKAWLMDEADNTYMGKEFKAKLVVNAYQESNYAKDVIKSKLVKYSESSKDTFPGGLVAVNTNGELYNETESSQEIREYRYSGPNVNNYVTFNDETWRIIGVFTDETNASHIKIVKQNLFEYNLPQKYVVNNITYTINSGVSNVPYWNYITGTTSDMNDWTTAGLQYYLNTEKDENGTVGYLSKLSYISKKMIADTKYYLGNARFFQIAKVTYEDERKDSICPVDVTETTDTSNCNIWNGNQATWTGKIGLMYPSDWSYSANSKYWTTTFSTYSNEAKNSTWMYETFDSAKEITTMFISPGTLNKYYIVNVRGVDGGAGAYYVYNYNTGTARPTLYLKSDVKIISGDGSINNQYKLSID